MCNSFQYHHSNGEHKKGPSEICFNTSGYGFIIIVVVILLILVYNWMFDNGSTDTVAYITL